MVDINALNTALWGITVISAVAVALAIAGIVLAWVSDRNRRAQQVTTGVRAVEAHLEEAARERAAS
jgi:VIT1/CCC1 family predicted Fe2+/Mn2+ transporter